MATWDSLSQSDKDRVQAALQNIRPLSNEIYQLAQKCGPVISDWNGGTSAIIASLDALEEVPNATSLAGALPLAKENIADNLLSYITTVSGLATTAHRDNIVPAAGAVNVMTGE